jgi:hypothetical protein
MFCIFVAICWFQPIGIHKILFARTSEIRRGVGAAIYESICFLTWCDLLRGIKDSLLKLLKQLLAAVSDRENISSNRRGPSRCSTAYRMNANLG